MPTASWILWGLALPGALATAVVLVLGRLWPRPSRFRVGLAWLLAVAAAYATGHGAVEGWPTLPAPNENYSRWDLLETQVRLAVVFLPAAVVVLALTLLPRRNRWAGVVAVAALAAGLVWMMVTPGARQGWSAGQSRAWQAGLMVGTAAAALSVRELSRRAPGPWFSVALTLTVLAASAAPSLHNFSAGERGMALAAGLIGATAAGSLVSLHVGRTVGLTLAVLLLSGLMLEIFFAPDREVGPLILLAVTPFSGWLVELPAIHRLRPWLRGLIRIALMAGPAAGAAVWAGLVFAPSLE